MALFSDTPCRPAWALGFLGNSPTINSGCSLSGGNILCNPEDMRADAESQLQQMGVADSLSLSEYTLARYMECEYGNGSPEERIGIGLAGINQAKRRGTDVNGLLLSPSGYYGPIHGPGGQSAGSAYGRWACTASDPSVHTLLLAKLALSGTVDGFTLGGDDQDGPDAFDSMTKALDLPRQRAEVQSQYWIGPVAGINPWHTFIYNTRPDLDPKSGEGLQLKQAGTDALANMDKYQWQAWVDSLPFCSQYAGFQSAALASGIVLAVGWGFLNYIWPRISSFNE